MGNFNMLPVEIMLEILSRVPAEYVLECKCVSKSWKNVVQHPSFSKLHLNHLNDFDSGKLSFIFYTYCKVEEKLFNYTEYDENLNRFSRSTRIKLRLPFEECYILNSCNGLICFNKFNDYHGPSYICNPITREYILLPKSKSVAREFLSGFGYIPSTDEYKVVKIVKSLRDLQDIQVYTLGSGTGWRNVGNIDYDLMPYKQPGVFVNGVLHWRDHRGTIFSFDLAEEKFLSLPCLPQTGSFNGSLRVLGDFLCAYDVRAPRDKDIWFYKKNRNNQDGIWSKEFSGVHYDVTPITFTMSGGLLCYDRRDRNVYRCALETPSSRMLVDFGEIFQFGVPHKNTLVSLKALGEEGTKLMDSGVRAGSNGETENSNH